MGETGWKAVAVLTAGAVGAIVPLPPAAGAAAGVAISFPGSLVTTEAGGSSTFSVALEQEPTAPVSISLASSDPTEGTVSPLSIVFDAATWSTPVPITVTGVDDPDDDGDLSYEVLTGSAVSDDPAYSGLDVPDLTFVNVDDEDTPGFVVTPLDLTVLESGTTASFTIALTARPTADVVVGHTSTDATEGTVSPAATTFTPDDWSTPRSITVTGVDDRTADSDVDYRIDQVVTSTDPAYSLLVVPSVAVTTLDDETPDVVVLPPATPTTTEAGGTATYQVRLTSRPLTDVVVGAASTDATEGSTAPTSARFSRSNWNVLQTITVTGVDDPVDDGDQAYSIHHTVTTTDPRYRTVVVEDVALTNRDDDTAGVRFTPSSGLRVREGATATFTVVLLSQPTADVTVTHSSSDTAEGTLDPGSTTFGPKDWDQPRTITVTGVRDGIVDGDRSFFVEHRVASDDPRYAVLGIPRQRIVAEDEGVGVTTSTTTSSTVPRSTTTLALATTAPASTAGPTVAVTPTTTAVASEGPGGTVTTTTTVTSTAATLPRTGVDPRRVALIGGAALGTGLLVQVAGRRRPRRS